MNSFQQEYFFEEVRKNKGSQSEILKIKKYQEGFKMDQQLKKISMMSDDKLQDYCFSLAKGFVRKMEKQDDYFEKYNEILLFLVILYITRLQELSGDLLEDVSNTFKGVRELKDLDALFMNSQDEFLKSVYKQTLPHITYENLLGGNDRHLKIFNSALSKVKNGLEKLISDREKEEE